MGTSSTISFAIGHTRGPAKSRSCWSRWAISVARRTESFGALDNADLTYGHVRDENGELVELSKGRYHLLLESRNRPVRKEAYDAFLAAYDNHKHVLASLHAGTVRKDVFYAKARSFPSARAMALNANAIDERVYDTLIDVTRAHTGTVARYLELRRQLLGVDQLEIYDSWVPLSQLPTVHYSWAEAIDVVCEGLAAMGDAYVSRMREGLTTGRWVDVYETKGKRSGAYSWGAYGSHPVILMNWNGTLSDVFTLAHEAGHAMHTYLADAAQSYQDSQYPIFLAEIASTLNEVLLTWHLLGKIPAEDTMARFAILNRFADQIMGTHVRQTMFAEFERDTHRIVESSQPLTLQQLNALFADLYRVYTPGVNVDEVAEIGWARIPHFYTGFYVFQYATGISAGIALAKQVRDEGQAAVERVIRLFESGGKDYPLPLLKEAGVDLTEPDAIEASMSIFDETVTELETIAQLRRVYGHLTGMDNRAAEKIRSFGTSVFAEMSRLAVEHKAVNLGQGFPDFAGPEFVKESAKRAIDADLNQYAISHGHPRLRRAIANEFDSRFDLDVIAETDVTVASGATEVIFDAIQAFIGPGDNLVAFEPFYDSYPAATRMAGGTFTPIRLHPPDWSFDRDALRRRDH